MTAAGEESPRCWWCGVEPEEVHELRTLNGKVRDLLHWPPGDHEHRVQPPTADELADQAMRHLAKEIG